MKRWLTLLALAVTVTTAASLSHVSPVHADLSSDQFAVYDNVGNIGMYCVVGLNQNHDPVGDGSTYPCWQTTGWQTDFYGFWWENHATASIYEYNYSGAYQNMIQVQPNVTSNNVSWWCMYASPSFTGWQC